MHAMNDNQSKIIDVLDDLRSSNTYVHNEIIDGIKFSSPEFISRPVYLVETLAIVNALVPNGTMMLYGGHGGGKTTLCKILGQIFTNRTPNSIEEAILRGHPQLTEEKILGSLNLKQMLDPASIPDHGNIEVHWNEFVKSQWKIIDEVNRLSPYSQNILLSLLAEGVVKYQNQTRSVHGYTVFATMNPKDEGNFELPMPFMDRFAIALPITMPDYASMQTIGKKNKSQSKPSSHLFHNNEELNDLQDEINIKIKYQPEAEELINAIISDYRVCIRTAKEASESLTVDNGLCGSGENECHYIPHVCSKIKNPLSVRVKEDLFRYGKAIAWFLGDKEVNKKHIQVLAPYMIWHRSHLSKRFIDETIGNSFKTNTYYINPELEGTKKIVELIIDRFGKKYSKFLKPIKKAHNAELSKTELEKLITDCEEAAVDDLLIKKELLPTLKELEKNIEKIKEYKEKIKGANTHAKLSALQDKIKREYQIKNRQILSKKIEQKKNRLKIEKYEKQVFRIVFGINDRGFLIDNSSDRTSDLGKRLEEIYGSDFNFIPRVSERASLTSSHDEYDLEVTPRKKPKDKIELEFWYRGPENSNIANMLKEYDNK